MNFDLKTQEKEIKATIETLFGEAELEALAAMESTAIAGLRKTTLQLQRALAKTAWWTLGISDETEGSITSMFAVDTAVAKVSASFYLALQNTRLFSSLLANNFKSSTIETILKNYRAGELIGAVAFSEDSGQSLPETSLEQDSDSFRLSGQKSYVANSAIADFILVFAKDGEKQFLCLVDPKATGVMRTARIDTLGLKGLTYTNLVFDQLELAGDMVVDISGSKTEQYYKMHLNLILSAAATGVMQNSLKQAQTHARAYLKNGKPLMAKQGIRFELAEMLTLLQGSELLAQRAVWSLESGDFEALTISQCAAIFTCKQAENLSSKAMQLMTTEGYTSDSLIARAFNDAKGISIAGADIHESTMEIANTLLERY